VIAGTATALPPHHYDQVELAELAQRLLPELDIEPGTLARFFRRVGVRSRHLALPAHAYRDLDGLASRSRAWFEVATELGEQCVLRALEAAEVEGNQLHELMTTTVTGLAVPSLEARLMNRLELPRELV
jgi:alkylresorcinol/alkylpyrone synthase